MVRVFRHYFPRSLLLLALIEGLIFLGAIYLGRFIRIYTAPYNIGMPGLVEFLPQASIFMIVMLAIMTGMGLYERNFWDGKVDMILRVGVSFLLGLFIMTLIYYILPAVYVGRVEFGYAFSAAFSGVILARFVFLHISDQYLFKRRILVLGVGAKAEELEKLIGDTDNPGFYVVGYVPLEGESVAVSVDKVIRQDEDKGVYALTEAQQIDEILVTVDDQSPAFPVNAILECKVRGVEITDFLTFYERETGKIRLDDLRASNLIFSDGFHQVGLKNTSKRLFDVLASLLLLSLTWPVMLLAALAIWLESGCRGPILYVQERIGKDEQIFKVLKFRSMRVDAERDGVAQWAQKNDSRVTRVGNFIRKTRIDELPQVLNVLRGNMSFVGPRPERPQFVEELSKTIPFYSMRHRVNPGITGWAQICYPYGASEEDAREKLQYDLYYIKNYSLFLDLMVLLQTAYVIFWGKGAR